MEHRFLALKRGPGRCLRQTQPARSACLMRYIRRKVKRAGVAGARAPLQPAKACGSGRRSAAPPLSPGPSAAPAAPARSWWAGRGRTRLRQRCPPARPGDGRAGRVAAKQAGWVGGWRWGAAVQNDAGSRRGSPMGGPVHRPRQLGATAAAASAGGTSAAPSGPIQQGAPTHSRPFSQSLPSRAHASHPADSCPPTLAPICARVKARFTAVVDLPTPAGTRAR